MATKPLDAQRVHELWEQGQQARSTTDNEVYQNLAFIYDDHYTRFDRGITSAQTPDNSDGKVRLTINMMKPLWRGELGRMLKAHPIPECVPGSDSDEDRNAARIGNRFLTSELDRLNFPQVRAETLAWTTTAGWAYMHPAWDKATKQITLDVVTPGEIVRDPAARTRLNQGMYCIHGRILTVEEIEEQFGMEIPGGAGNHRTLNLSNLVGGWTRGGSGSSGGDGVLVLRMWHKPCRRYPQGLVITTAGGQEVERFEEYPFAHGELPFIDFHHVRLPGRFEGQSSIRSAWGAQRNFNHSASRQAEARELFAVPRMMGAKGSFDHERLSSAPGEWWQYNVTGMHKPEAVQFPSPASFLFEEKTEAYQQMQEIFSHREVSRGQLPGSDVAASAVAMLKEADDSALAPITQGIEDAIADVGRHILSLCKQYWTSERAVKTWSEETHSHVVEMWSGEDLDGSYDVRVVPGSALPKSVDQQRQDILALADRKLVTDPRLILKHMELPNGEGLMRQLDESARKANREHDRIYKKWTESVDPEMTALEEPLAPEYTDEDDVHMAEHTKLFNSEEFESWPPGAKAEAKDHFFAHKEQKKQKAIEQAQEQVEIQAAAMPPMPEGPMPPGPQDGSQNQIPGVNTAPPEEMPPDEALPPDAIAS